MNLRHFRFGGIGRAGGCLAWPAVLGSEGLRICKSESQGVKGQNCPTTIATTESYTINLGTIPESHRLRAVQARNGRGGSAPVERRMNKSAPPSHVLQNQKVTGSAWRR